MLEDGVEPVSEVTGIVRLMSISGRSGTEGISRFLWFKYEMFCQLSSEITSGRPSGVLPPPPQLSTFLDEELSHAVIEFQGT